MMTLRHAVRSAWHIAALAIAALTRVGSDAAELRIPYEHYTLSNGLGVILIPDSSKTFATVAVGYRVGARDDPAKGPGLAHLLEHLALTTDSKHVPARLRNELTEGSGGLRNATTSHDETLYVNRIPGGAIERALWFEADIMGFLADGFSEILLKREIDVVGNEALQRGRPTRGLLAQALYPPGHPYRLTVTGDERLLRALTVADVREFYNAYYGPNNAVLTVVGAFNQRSVKGWVAKHFASLPARRVPAQPRLANASVQSEHRFTWEEAGPTARIELQWPTVPAGHRDEAPLTVLKTLFAGSPMAHLAEALTADAKVAAAVAVEHEVKAYAGGFLVAITLDRGVTCAQGEQALDRVLEAVRQGRLSADEVAAAAAEEELRFVRALSSSYSEAARLTGDLLLLGDPAAYRAAYAAVRRVGPADLIRVTRQYLTPARAIVCTTPGAGRSR